MTGVGPVIVVGVDGSPSSWDAFDWALGQAQRGEGRLVVVHATPVAGPPGALGAPFGYGAVEQAAAELSDQIKTEASQRAGELDVHVSFIRGEGDSARVLTQIAVAQKADLLVVGRSGSMLHRLGHSMGRRLVSRHDAPVVAVVP